MVMLWSAREASLIFQCSLSIERNERPQWMGFQKRWIISFKYLFAGLEVIWWQIHTAAGQWLMVLLWVQFQENSSSGKYRIKVKGTAQWRCFEQIGLGREVVHFVNNLFLCKGWEGDLWRKCKREIHGESSLTQRIKEEMLVSQLIPSHFLIISRSLPTIKRCFA